MMAVELPSKRLYFMSFGLNPSGWIFLKRRVRLTLGDDCAAVERDHGADLRHGFEVEGAIERVGREKHHRIRVIDDILGIGGAEVVQYRHNYGSVCYRGHEGDDPVGGVASQKSHLVAWLHSGEFEEQMEPSNAARHVTIAACFPSRVVGKSRECEVVCKACLIDCKQVVERCVVVWFFELIKLHSQIIAWL